mgnify:CR=1 FL=1
MAAEELNPPATVIAVVLLVVCLISLFGGVWIARPIGLEDGYQRAVADLAAGDETAWLRVRLAREADDPQRVR